MKVIAVLAQKGGVAKSTICRSIAVSALLDGMKSAIIDLDPQASCIAWAKRRTAEARAVEGTDQPLAEKLDWLGRRGADLVLIDTPPSDQPTINLAAQQAHFCIIPCGIGPEEVEAVGGVTDIVRSLRKPTPSC